jgi:hypothetical protein
MHLHWLEGERSILIDYIGLTCSSNYVTIPYLSERSMYRNLKSQPIVETEICLANGIQVIYQPKGLERYLFDRNTSTYHSKLHVDSRYTKPSFLSLHGLHSRNVRIVRNFSSALLNDNWSRNSVWQGAGLGLRRKSSSDQNVNVNMASLSY